MRVKSHRLRHQFVRRRECGAGRGAADSWADLGRASRRPLTLVLTSLSTPSSMAPKQRMRLANDKAAKNVTQRGNVPKTTVRAGTQAWEGRGLCLGLPVTLSPTHMDLIFTIFTLSKGKLCVKIVNYNTCSCFCIVRLVLGGTEVAILKKIHLCLSLTHMYLFFARFTLSKGKLCVLRGNSSTCSCFNIVLVVWGGRRGIIFKGINVSLSLPTCGPDFCYIYTFERQIMCSQRKFQYLFVFSYSYSGLGRGQRNNI